MLKFNLIRDKFLPHQPSRVQLAKWLRKSTVFQYSSIVLSVSIVDQNLSQQLNFSYRQQNKPTNVISIEYAETRDTFNLLSGELILCDDIIINEANSQNKPILAHYAHMVVHGMLHLQGFDHDDDQSALEMEKLEAEILIALGFANPY